MLADGDLVLHEDGKAVGDRLRIAAAGAEAEIRLRRHERLLQDGAGGQDRLGLREETVGAGDFGGLAAQLDAGEHGVLHAAGADVPDEVGLAEQVLRGR